MAWPKQLMENDWSIRVKNMMGVAYTAKRNKQAENCESLCLISVYSARFVGGGGINPSSPLVSSTPQVFIDPLWLSQKYSADPLWFYHKPSTLQELRYRFSNDCEAIKDHNSNIRRSEARINLSNATGI